MTEQASKKFRILVVDDDESILDTFQLSLSQKTSNLSLETFDVVSCQQGEVAVDAVKLAGEAEKPFAVAFIDISMPPGKDGIWTAEQIRALDPDIEIVIMTGYYDVDLGDITRRVLPVHKLLYAQKPIHFQELLQFAHALSMKWYTGCELQKVLDQLNSRVQDQSQVITATLERLNIVINATRDGIWDWNINTNKTLYTERCFEIIEYPDGDKLGYILDSDFWETRIHPDDHKRAVKALKDHLEKGITYNVDYRFRTKSEVYRWLNSRGQALFDENGKPFRMVGCIRDITDFKDTQRKLYESEVRFRNFFDNMVDVPYETDSSGNITYTNNSTKALTGLPKDQIIGKPFLPLVAPEFRQHAMDSFQKSLGGARVEFELTFASGKVASFINEPLRDKNDKVIGIFGVARDITERKKAETALVSAQMELESKVEERTAKLKDALSVMTKKEKEVKKHKKSLEKLNNRLMETNQALSALARNIDADKELLEQKINKITSTKIMPIIRNLRNNNGCRKCHADLGVLADYIHDFSPVTKKRQQLEISLSEQEMRVAVLIRDGLTSPEIADSLCISLDTVKTHRKNIRKKLKIQNADVNLSSYLKTSSLD